jgi:hypothetical protein
MAGYPHPREDSTRAPFEVIVGTVGKEAEFCSGSLVSWLYDQGLTPDDHLHGYQCNCSRRNDYLVHSTADSTAHGGEYVIGGAQGVLFGSDTYIAAIKALTEAIVECRPGVDEHVGMHTHVGMQKQDGTEMTMTEKKRLLRNYLALEDQILVLAAGAFRSVRNNGCTTARLNSRYYTSSPGFWTCRAEDIPVGQLPGRPTLNFCTGKGTIEFRVWNATRVDWRMILAGAVSSGLVEAACQERDAGRPGDMDLLEHLEHLLNADMIQLVERQRKAFATNGGRLNPAY